MAATAKPKVTKLAAAKKVKKAVCEGKKNKTDLRKAIKAYKDQEKKLLEEKLAKAEKELLKLSCATGTKAKTKSKAKPTAAKRKAAPKKKVAPKRKTTAKKATYQKSTYR